MQREVVNLAKPLDIHSNRINDIGNSNKTTNSNSNNECEARNIVAIKYYSDCYDNQRYLADI